MNDKTIVIALSALIAASLATVSPAGISDPAQGEGTLTQSPLSLGGGATPAFIMAVDDSGSMTYQILFPGQDGQACWTRDLNPTGPWGLFHTSGPNVGKLRTTSTGSGCSYYYVLPGPRGSGKGIPPLDILGATRSPDFNPQYFNPYVTYQPWIGANLQPYPQASVTMTRIDPDDSSADNSVNLFSDLKSTKWDFRMYNGMTLPAGTEYSKYDSDDKKWGGWKTKDEDDTWDSDDETRLAIKYYPAEVFLAEPITISGYGLVSEVANACGTGCSLWKYRPTSAGAKQNFANWFSFYGNRNRAMIAGMTLSFKDVSKLNVGYFTINKRKQVTMRSMDVASEKSALFKEMLKLPASGNTPNRYAVQHIGEQFQRTGPGAPIQTSCQKNAAMLFTDGYSNNGSPGGGNADSSMGAPFADSHPNTLADIATSFYLDNDGRSPLNTDFAAGKVPTPLACEGANPDKRLDCQSNLHMNFYGITLGAKGDLFGITYGVLPDGTADGALATEQALSGPGSPAWRAYEDNKPSTVDEIWHATMNTRGKFINASTPAKITEAMSAVLAAVSAEAGQSGSLTVSGARVGTNSFSLSPSFGVDGSDWFGQLAAFGMAYSSSTGKLEPTLQWEASSVLPAHSSRNIHYGTTTVGTAKPTVRRFIKSSADLTLQSLCAGYSETSTCATRIATLASRDEAIDYLRGDGSNTGTGKKLRTRTTRLGDIINSAPVVASPRDDYGYASLLGTGSDAGERDPYNYEAYLATKSGLGSAVYVGANDGMLHAFNGATGVETFAYIPSTAVGFMGNLLFPDIKDFQHRYYVDGQITVSDVRYGSAWHTVLVGGSGAGGRGMFAIDVTTPNSPAAPNVLWEVNDQSGGTTGDRIGHVLAKPLIVPVRAKNGATSWKAVFGNGYGSEAGADGSVYLFVVDIESGIVSTIKAKETSGGLSRPNGLGNIVALDRKLIADGTIRDGSDGFTDTIYGGDLHGNIWRFDLTDGGSFQLSGDPVFTAKDSSGKRQPITGGIEVAVGPKGGVMVLFGTGSFMFEKTGNISDKTNSDMQTIYGVLDVEAPTTTATLLRGNLQAQTLDADTGIVSNIDPNYYGDKSGWFLDLNSTVKNSAGIQVPSGERMVGRPRLERGTFLFPTYSPSSTDPCAGGGTNALYGLKALTGGGDLGSFRQEGKDPAAEGTGKIELASSGSSPVMDVGIFASPGVDALGELLPDETEAEFQARLAARLGEARCDVMVVVPGADPLYRWRACGRQSWRQVR